MTIGVISDTHGLLRAEAMAALAGADRIVHAGDIGGESVLESLRRMAPVTAVRGNNDKGAWATMLPATEVVEAGSLLLYVLHELSHLDLDPAAAAFSAVISGHSHKPSAELRGGVLYLNPGSAGPRRFSLPTTVARLHVAGGKLRHEIIDLGA
jgi:putative phosphoesterase